ncbi:hypothetical protein, partial [Mediterraneibacter faecis]|uniref:hypothetical protein n=1 Tax=Mediterraneibacter faecis TaxID=592978 RepID=UPI001EDE816D
MAAKNPLPSRNGLFNDLRRDHGHAKNVVSCPYSTKKAHSSRHFRVPQAFNHSPFHFSSGGRGIRT